MEIIRNGTRLDRKAYRKPTDTGLLLHYHSHVHIKYKHSLLKTMLNRAFKLSSNWQFFHQECERLRVIFTRLHYPESLIQNTIKVFVEMKATGNTRPAQQLGEIPVRIPLPFKDQRSANKLREQLRARLHGEFQPGLKFQRAEISARLLKQILLKSNCRLHGDFFSPGRNSAPRAEKISCNRKEISARAEKQEIIWLPDSPETLRAKFHIWCRD